MSDLKSIGEANKVDKKITELKQYLEKNEEIWGDIDNLSIQHLTEILIKIYALKVSNSEYEKPFMPISNNRKVTETEAAIFSDKLLQMANIEIFELQIWRNMGTGSY